MEYKYDMLIESNKHGLKRRREKGIGRVYTLPDGTDVKYPSVTAITGLESKEAIKRWREKVGAAEAQRVLNRASAIGTRAHSLIESYIRANGVANAGYEHPPYEPKNDTDALRNEIALDHFERLQPVVDLSLSKVLGVECRVYSPTLQCAGTVDLIANFDGRTSVIDFKTSARAKRREWLTGYFLQAFAYRECLWELEGLDIPQLVVILSVEGAESARIYTEDAEKWREPFLALREAYRKEYGL